MPIYQSGQAMKAFKGDYAPVNIFKGDSKVAGWKYSELSGNSLLIPDTYNDSCSITIYGKSEQTQTSQSKNIYDANKYKFELLGSNATLTSDANNVYTFTGNANTYGIRTISGVPVKPNTNYVFSCKVDILSGALATSGYGCRIQFLSDNTYTNTKAWNITFNSGNNTSIKLCVYVGMSDPNAITVNFSQFQLEEGTVATVYTPFVPNSPSPDYPSAINNVSNFNLISCNMIDKTQSVNFPYTLRSLPNGICDQIIINNISKTAKLVKNIDLITLPSGNSWDIQNAKPNSMVLSTHLCNTYLTGTALSSAETMQSNFDVIFELAVPIITDLTYKAVLTYYPQTQISTYNSNIYPFIDGCFKITDS